MTKEELVEFLKNNLTVEVVRLYGEYNRHEGFVAKLVLQGEEISSCEFAAGEIGSRRP